MKALLIVALALLTGGTSVSQAENSPDFHFRYDIAPHLSRAGCATADCHGGATGRGGFKLSLFATNARADYEAITQDLDARRINFRQPARSLVLLKPTRQMRHKGGRVIDRDSPAYQALERWIAEGAPFSRGDTGDLSALDLVLDESDGKSRAVVTATFRSTRGDSYQRDVTGLSRFESTDERVATVDKEGEISIHGPGEAWILARYADRSARQLLLQSFGLTAGNTEEEASGGPGAFWRKKLNELGLKPASPAGPHRLVRRLFLDLAGRPPTPEDITAFLNLPADTRIPITARALLASGEFTDQLARHLEHWFEVPRPAEDLKHTRAGNARLRAAIRDFAKRDESLLGFASSMLDTPENRVFIQRLGDPRDRAEFVGRAHLGMSIGCARCHNHPSDRWSQAQHLQFSALFADPRPTTGSERGGESMRPGKFFLPGDGKPVEPAFLPIVTPPRPVHRGVDFGTQLATFLREDGREAFARNSANRLVGILTGIHLVEAPDDHRLSNPARHEPFLAALARAFQAHDHRIRPLVEAIVTSPIYALESSPPVDERTSLGGDPELRYLARREARPMSGDEFLRSVAFVLGVPPPSGPAPAQPLAQQLQLLNSGLLQKWLGTPGNQVEALLTFEPDPVARLEGLYLLILSRPPRPEERTEFLPLLSASDNPGAAARDLAFALFASREFRSLR